MSGIEKREGKGIEQNNTPGVTHTVTTSHAPRTSPWLRSNEAGPLRSVWSDKAVEARLALKTYHAH